MAAEAGGARPGGACAERVGGRRPPARRRPGGAGRGGGGGAAGRAAGRGPPAGGGGGGARTVPARAAWLDWLREAEHAWLGLAAVSWREGAALAGWRADEPDAYCPRCGTSAGPYEADADGCPTCRGKRLPWGRAVRLGSYEGVLRDAVLAGKYTAWRRVCQELGADLGLAVGAALGRAGIDPAGVVICPVPTSTRRRLARGVDHTVVMGREVARMTGGRLVRGLERRHTRAQAGLAASARARNVSGVFVARAGVCQGMTGRVVVLVDDVRTTGATLRAAARALRGAFVGGVGGPSAIWTAVAGVTPRPGSGAGASTGWRGPVQRESARSVKIGDPES